MYTILICAILTVIFSIKTFTKEKDLSLIIASVFIMLVVGGMCGFLITLAIPTQMKQEVFSKYNIVCLQDNNMISGRFFLGSGNINGEMKYTFYYEDNGVFKMKTIPVYNTVIKYSDNPIITTYGYIPTDDIINKFGFVSLNENWGNICYVIEIPKGTIKTEYSLDAK